jgi:hypothetical protein
MGIRLCSMPTPIGFGGGPRIDLRTNGTSDNSASPLKMLQQYSLMSAPNSRSNGEIASVAPYQLFVRAVVNQNV